MMMKVVFRHTNTQHLSEQGYTIEEEIKIYDDQLDDILANPRWYLDSLPTLRSYRVRWKDYRNNTPVLPYKYTKNYTEE